MQILETHALSEKEAIQLTVKYLDVEPENINVKVHKKGGSGFWGFGDKKPNTYYVFAIEGKTPRDVVIKGVLSTIIHKMGYKAKVVEIKDMEGGKVYTEIASPKAGHLIGRKGRTLEALQNMTNLLLERFLGKPSKIILDIENYRDRREKSLENLAQRMAEQVEKMGRSRMLDPMNPYERRIIHATLQDHEKVTTDSLGTGNYKKIRIRLIDGIAPASSEEGALPREMYEDKNKRDVNSDDESMPSFDGDVEEDFDGNAALPQGDDQPPDEYNR